MKLSKIVIVLLIGFTMHFSSPALSQESPNPCSDMQTQADMNSCAYNGFLKADKELNNLYRTQIKFLETSTAKDRFKKAQQFWIKFRDASCLYEIGPREESGSIWPFLFNDCLRVFTQKRTEELKTYTECRGDQCPR